jgi:PilZ domain
VYCFVPEDEARHRIKEQRALSAAGHGSWSPCPWTAGVAEPREVGVGYQIVFGSAVVSMPPFTQPLNFLAQINGMAERRILPRQRVFKAGTIEFDGTGVDCIVRNISATGAGLEVASPAGIPHEITLSIRSCEIRRHAYIVWRKEKRIGVAFG